VSELKSKFKIFHNVGSIYVSKACKHSTYDLKRLIRACGGNCIKIKDKANIVIGEFYTKKYICETWILECVKQGKLLPMDKNSIILDV
jgi:hypothetical protein